MGTAAAAAAAAAASVPVFSLKRVFLRLESQNSSHPGTSY
jgi:hypothetical protein